MGGATVLVAAPSMTKGETFKASRNHEGKPFPAPLRRSTGQSLATSASATARCILLVEVDVLLIRPSIPDDRQSRQTGPRALPNV